MNALYPKTVYSLSCRPICLCVPLVHIVLFICCCCFFPQRMSVKSIPTFWETGTCPFNVNQIPLGMARIHNFKLRVIVSVPKLIFEYSKEGGKKNPIVWLSLNLSQQQPGDHCCTFTFLSIDGFSFSFSTVLI